MNQSNNRIVKNTLFLYARMIFVLLTNLYMSRVIFQSLGIVDYGVYNIVGGVVVLFSYINSALSVATTRFFSYEMHNGVDRLNEIFNTSIKIQATFSLLVVILAETIGLWLVNNELVIPPERIYAANIVYQLSIITTTISILRIPYESAITSHEHMHIYALFSIVEVLIKLALVLSMKAVSFDKLIYYSIMIAIISIIGVAMRLFYCTYKYPEIKIKRGFNKNLFKQMLSFVGWNFFGATAGMSVSQGLSFVINIFFGPAVNAARGIAIQVEGTVGQFASSINTAINPQIIKRYSVNDKDGMFSLAFFSSKMTFILLFILSLPIIFNIDYILLIWLGEIPDYADIFTQLELGYILSLSLTYSINMCAQASGKIKLFQFVESCVLLLNIPFSMVLYKLGCPPYSAFISLIIVSLCAILAKLCVINKTILFPMSDYVTRVIFPVLTTVLILLILYNPLSLSFSTDSFLIFIAKTLIVWAIFIPTLWFAVLNKSERKIVKKYANNILNKIR